MTISRLLFITSIMMLLARAGSIDDEQIAAHRAVQIVRDAQRYSDGVGFVTYDCLNCWANGKSKTFNTIRLLWQHCNSRLHIFYCPYRTCVFSTGSFETAKKTCL